MGNWWYHIEQIPFLEGYFSTEKLNNFIHFMNNDKMGLEYYYKIYNIRRVSNTGFWNKIFPTEKIILDLTSTNIPRKKYFNLTRQKSSHLRVNLDTTEWEEYTNLWDDTTSDNHLCYDYDFKGYENIESILVKNTVKVIITGKEYNKGCVTNLILRWLQTF